ncbi:hypothetical protein [Polymorphospora rubra]|uniref:Uncharacterized protein n=1 Tax=Polymorphospora rubra TaxID=338584 RepID=A0A810N7B6_9ACTN|nr:hypothetical protein [Polymorphospora rubra]BCJ67305.1 hypothetical protein Prubr_43260 [Polymorphospora rubra]
MSGPNGSLWVDPEGVLSVSRAYDGHIAMYDRYLSRLDQLRAQYANAWGDDEIGNQFREQFDNTMDVVEGIILGVRGSVEYAAVGLRISGEGYRQAEDDAIEAGRIIGTEFAALPTQVASRQPGEHAPQYASRQPALPAVEAGTLTPMHAARRADKPALQVGVRLQGELIDAEEVAGTPMIAAVRQPAEPALQSRRAVQGRLLGVDSEDDIEQPTSRLAAHLPGEPALQSRRAVQGRLLGVDSEDDIEQPTSRLAAQLPADPGVLPTFTPAMPLTSAHISHPTEGVLIDGAPVPEGFELRTLNTFEDDTSRLDVNYYDSVFPLGDRHVVTGPDGQPLNPGDGHLFLVKPQENPIDPTSPDYHPILFSFAADGTAVPL